MSTKGTKGTGGTKAKKVILGDCALCGRPGQLWHTKPRTFLCGGLVCRAKLLWPRERWEAQWDLARRRMHVGEELSELDLWARKVVRGRVEGTVPMAVMVETKGPKGKGAGAKTRARKRKGTKKHPHQNTNLGI